jgi:hypothetical protein
MRRAVVEPGHKGPAAAAALLTRPCGTRRCVKSDPCLPLQGQTQTELQLGKLQESTELQICTVIIKRLETKICLCQDQALLYN